MLPGGEGGMFSLMGITEYVSYCESVYTWQFDFLLYRDISVAILAFPFYLS